MVRQSKSRNFRIWGIIPVAVILFLLVGQMISRVNASGESISTNEEVVSFQVEETIEASGSLEAQPFAGLTWKTDGVVESVNVKPGDKVKAGDILMALQPSSTSANIVAAQADLINAQETLDDLLISGTALAQAQVDLKEAIEAYEKADNYLTYLQNDENVPQTLYTAKLVQTRNGWEYEYDLDNFKGPAPEDWIVDAERDLALKKAQMEDAQREYDRLLAGEDSADVAIARAEVEAAQTTVNSLYIVAPFDGEVLSVEDVTGDLVSTGAISVNLADMQYLYVETQVDESDVANVELGDPVTATIDALPDVTLTGQVATINPVGEVVSGLVKYAVRVDLEKATDQDFIPLGTTVNVTIRVAEAVESLAVPITTIHNDANGEFVLVIQNDGSTQRVEVVSGAIVDDMVVVSGALQAGSLVQVNNGSSFEAPNPFGGGGE